MHWLILCMLLLVVNIHVPVWAQTRLPYDTLIEGHFSFENPAITYTFHGEAGQYVVAAVEITTDEDIYMELSDSSDGWQAGSSYVLGESRWYVMLTHKLPFTDTFQLTVELDNLAYPDQSTIPYNIMLSTFDQPHVPKDPCSSNLSVGHYAQIMNPHLVQPYLGDANFNRYLDQYSGDHPYAEWSLHIPTRAIEIDPPQPVFLAEGPACLGGYALWRVRAQGLHGEPKHFWMYEQFSDHILLKDPFPVDPETYEPSLTVLKGAAPQVNPSIQLAFYGGGGPEPTSCEIPNLDTSIINYRDYITINAYMLSADPVIVSIFRPDGSLYIRESKHIIEERDYCVPLYKMDYFLSPPWNEPFGVWIVEFTTSVSSQRIAFEIFPTTTQIKGEMVCSDMRPHFLLTGTSPNGTFNLVRLIDREVEGVEDVYDLEERQRWEISGDAYGNVLIIPDYNPEPYEMYVLETPDLDWRTLVEYLYLVSDKSSQSSSVQIEHPYTRVFTWRPC